MKKKMIVLLATVAIMGTVTGCCIEHEWKEATCVSPKTCAKCEETEGEVLSHTWVDATCLEAKHCESCGTTEGEALPHTWVDATYQTAQTCEVCNTVEGEPITPDFVKYNLSANCELDKEYEYMATNENKTNDLKGKVVFSDYKTFESDESHEAKDGYEWKAITLQVTFEDMTNEGFYVEYRNDDYYVIQPDKEDAELNEQGRSECYTVNWNGIDYTECVYDFKFDIDMNAKMLTMKFGFLLPIGYDGQTVGVYHPSVNADTGAYFYELPLAKDGVVFRLD